ncbi:unnamed protein product [Protopolystoma xenopodis]|uniref:Uncharacterized protein n=1 Tax=Protopolystoma xenopodis TaxID=117903 RepID=A0A3S5ABD4_9PLAT|nr:unnamed protein product [Protopolystoma xenopodis]
MSFLAGLLGPIRPGQVVTVQAHTGTDGSTDTRRSTHRLSRRGPPCNSLGVHETRSPKLLLKKGLKPNHKLNNSQP